MIPALKQNNYTHPLTLKGSIKLFWFWFWFWIDEIISRCFQPFQPCIPPTPPPPSGGSSGSRLPLKLEENFSNIKLDTIEIFKAVLKQLKKKDSGFLFLYFNFLVWCSATWLALWLAFFTVLYKPLKHMFYSINVLATLLVGITSNPLTP